MSSNSIFLSTGGDEHFFKGHFFDRLVQFQKVELFFVIFSWKFWKNRIYYRHSNGICLVQWRKETFLTRFFLCDCENLSWGNLYGSVAEVKFFNGFLNQWCRWFFLRSIEKMWKTFNRDFIVQWSPLSIDSVSKTRHFSISKKSNFLPRSITLLFLTIAKSINTHRYVCSPYIILQTSLAVRCNTSPGSPYHTIRRQEALFNIGFIGHPEPIMRTALARWRFSALSTDVFCHSDSIYKDDTLGSMARGS